MILKDIDRISLGMIDKRMAVIKSYDTIASFDSDKASFVSEIEGFIKSGATAVAIVKDRVFFYNTIDSEFFEISASSFQPDQVVQTGTITNTGNDVTINGTITSWIWRISNQIYENSTSQLFSITPPTAGNFRYDIITGNNTGGFNLISGTSAGNSDAAVIPSVPANQVGLGIIFSNDTGVTQLSNFALSAFVRFDIANQGLTPSQRQNARTNIEAVSRETTDTRTGALTNNGKVAISDSAAAGTALSVYKESESGSNNLFTLSNPSGIKVSVDSNGSLYSNRITVKSPFAIGVKVRDVADTADTIYLNSNGTIFQSRSVASTYSVRRDELYLTYPTTITGTGKLNDVALADGVGEIKFSSAVTEVSGIDANGDTKELLIWSDNPSGITLTSQDVLSIAANRFHRSINIPYQTWVKIVYDGDLARWVNGNTGELQETDKRYFEVVSDVLTLKYILPNIAALQAFVRDTAVIAYVSDPLRGGYFNYVSEADFVGTADNGISFPAQDGGYWVRDFNGDINLLWYGPTLDGIDDDTLPLINAFKGSNYEKKLLIPYGKCLFKASSVDPGDINSNFYGDFVKCCSINGNYSTIIIDGLIGFDTSEVIDFEVTNLNIESINGYGTDTTSGDINAVFYQSLNVNTKSRIFRNLFFTGDVVLSDGSQRYGEAIISYSNTLGIFENIKTENYKTSVRIFEGNNFTIDNVNAINSQTEIYTSDDCFNYKVSNIFLDNTFEQSQTWLGKNHPTVPVGINGLSLFLGGGDNYTLFNLNAINPTERCVYSQGGNVMASKLRCVNGDGFKFVGFSTSTKRNIKVTDFLLIINEDIVNDSVQPVVELSSVYWVEDIFFSDGKVVSTDNVTGNPLRCVFSLLRTSKNVNIENINCDAYVSESFLYPVLMSESGLSPEEYILSENVKVNNCRLLKNRQTRGSFIFFRRNEASVDAESNYSLKNVLLTNNYVEYGATADNFWYEYSNIDGLYAENNRANKRCLSQSGIPIVAQTVINNIVLKEKNIRIGTLTVFLEFLKVLNVSRGSNMHFIRDVDNRVQEVDVSVYNSTDLNPVTAFYNSSLLIKMYIDGEYENFTEMPTDYSIIVDSSDGYYIGKTIDTTRTDLVSTSAVTITQASISRITIRGELYAKKALITIQSMPTL